MITYLDNNATTEMLPEVKTLLMTSIAETGALNPSSIHSLGREAKHLVEAARNIIIKALNADLSKFNVIFTSSGTEANNTLIKGLNDNTDLFISAIEHSSLLKPAKKRSNTFIIKVTNEGLIDLNDLVQKLEQSKNTEKLISIMLANNETGVIQDFPKIIEVAKEHNAFVHTDASQAFGKMSFDFQELPVDAITISSHKIGGPLGASALIKRKKLKLIPLIEGGPQEDNMRAGTENILGIIGFAEAAKLIKATIQKYQDQKKNRDYLEKELKAIDKDLKIYAQNKKRLPNTSCIASSKFTSALQQIHMDLENIAISGGSACASGKVSKSHVLEAMDNNDELIQNAIRVTLGINSTQSDIKNFIDSWKKLYINGIA